jgi:hypothetical protein
LFLASGRSGRTLEGTSTSLSAISARRHDRCSALYVDALQAALGVDDATALKIVE